MAEPQQLHVITRDTEVKFSVSVSLKFSPPVRDLTVRATPRHFESMAAQGPNPNDWAPDQTGAWQSLGQVWVATHAVCNEAVSRPKPSSSKCQVLKPSYYSQDTTPKCPRNPQQSYPIPGCVNRNDGCALIRCGPSIPLRMQSVLPRDSMLSSRNSRAF